MDCESVSVGNLASESCIFKRKFRWMFTNDFIGNPSEANGTGLSVLPPVKGARPSLEFKEIEVQHTIEDFTIPGKVIWRPINLTLYEVCPPTDNPVWQWILRYYDPQANEWYPFLDKQFKVTSYLDLYTGCGDIIESWKFENSWPQQINWQDLDMGSSEVVTCEITLKYDRAYMCPAGGSC